MKSDIPQPFFLTVPEAARLCGVSRNTLYTWVRNGKLNAYQTPGRTNLIRPSDMVSFMQESGMFVPAALKDMAQRDETVHQDVNAEVAGDDRPAILVVDDEPSSRSVMVRALNRDYRMFQAQTGYEALHLLTMHKDVALVLLDLRMPGQHGLKTLQEVKALRPEIKVVIVTGFSEEIPDTVLADGEVARVIEKPITVANLLQVISEVLNGSSDPA